MVIAIAALVAAVGAVPAHAQPMDEGPSGVPVRLATLSGGVGNSHGWYGLEGGGTWPKSVWRSLLAPATLRVGVPTIRQA
jgi:hypothetical protein